MNWYGEQTDSRSFVVAILSALLLWPLGAAVSGAQSSAGRIVLTLTGHSGQPVVEVSVTLRDPNEAVLGHCTTDVLGRCEIALPIAPTDASGFIRGILDVGPHGRRSLLWPGGVLTLDLHLDAQGALAIPADLYVTRTPAPSVTAGATTRTATRPSTLAREAPRVAYATATLPAAPAAATHAQGAAMPPPFTALPLVVVLLAALVIGLLLYATLTLWHRGRA